MHSRRLLRRFVLASALLAPGVRAVSAQDAPRRPLTDADITRIIPLLRANISELQATRAEVSTVAELIATTDAAMTDRTLDPLPWLEEHGQDIIVPPAARYDTSCSKSASRFHSVPTAVFTLGRAPASSSGSGGNAAAAVLQAARNFYQARGFQSNRALSYRLSVWGFTQKDGSTNEVWEGNYLTVAEKLAGCESMSAGPMIVRRLNVKLSSASMVTNPQVLERSLRAAGMSRDDYENAVSDLTVARRMAGDSSMLGVLERTLSAMSGAEGARYRAFIGVSRANIAMFRAHATVLEPLLSAFGNLVGSTPQ